MTGLLQRIFDTQMTLGAISEDLYSEQLRVITRPLFGVLPTAATHYLIPGGSIY